MKKSGIAALAVFLVLIPLTLYLGSKIPGKSYYLTGTLIIVWLLIPFFMKFEGKKPQARELILIAVMCALAVAGRVAIPLSNFKAAFAVILISGIALGPETGFMIGAVTALVSNFFYGQGAYMPWQMMAYGAGGMAAGFAFAKGRIPKKPVPTAIFGALTVLLLVGPLLDVCNAFLGMPEVTLTTLAASFASGFPVNAIQAGTTGVLIFFLGQPLLDKLERAKLKYGIGEV